ncbi:c-type cytochrome [Psychroflexus sp. YR1-1]|uniref:C-type cytochrome n=1 Tax=Psychroflexus aurantiacus TaxID=2709310 RepID=A0A6B3RAE6_9FLAO|nr:c-type cytochrome [Psychroflexus aurantiacus]NEV94551.1 c-type cytochrome [Psychroflexus aurantiacus]
MKKSMERPFILKHFLLVSLLLFTFLTFAQDTAEGESSGYGSYVPEVVLNSDPAKGKELFNSLCAACHKRYKNATGPSLHRVTERREMDWLYEWIKNSQELIKSGDNQAVELYNEWNKVAMNAFPQLSNQDINDILAYVEEPKPEPKVAVAAPAGAETQGGAGISTEIVLGLLAVVLLVLSVILYLVNKTLNRFAEANGIPIRADKPKGKPIWVAFAENQFLIFVAVIFLLLAVAWGGYGFLMQVGVDQGYAPIQPIHYSHRIHAGENQIECKYCHSSARVSKHSGIPSLNVCMNCHKQIAEVAEETQAEGKKEYGVDYNAEIQKLYEATGWDTSTQSYTGETKPVKWIRIHNLPDFAYFNHSQHVSVAGIECQTCHGPVETYEIQKQYAPLTMGWCINCHRESKIQVGDNAYYEKIHEELSEKYGVEEFTVADMGGLECGKCHY